MLLGIAIILTAMLLAVVVFDVAKFIIPNELNLGFILIYPAFLVLTHEHIEWWWSLAVMAAFFAGGMLIFVSGVMGGGDVKLLIALSLWIGWQPEILAAFALWMALAGGALAIFLIITRGLVALLEKITKRDLKVPKVFTWKEPLPYGVAIAYAFGYLLWTGQIYGLKVII